MRPSLAPALDPLLRFRDIYQALGSGSRWWGDDAWLRFAAQAAVMQPTAPAETARAIQSTAKELAAHAHWHEAMASPLNQVVAATLVQIGETAASFTAELDAAHGLLKEAGFHVHGAPLVKTILVLRVLSDGKPTTLSMTQRMRLIYAQMKLHHWWLTGDEDVPACALLASSRGTPELIVTIAEGIYQGLRQGGLTTGHPLRTAANILPLAGLPAADAAARFLGLSEALRLASLPLWTEDYDAVALLSLLDHNPKRIVTRLEQATAALDALEPVQFAEVNFHVAANLVFLDLVRFDAFLRPIVEVVDKDRMHALIRMQHAASLILVHVPPNPALLPISDPLLPLSPI